MGLVGGATALPVTWLCVCIAVDTIAFLAATVKSMSLFFYASLIFVDAVGVKLLNSLSSALTVDFMVTSLFMLLRTRTGDLATLVV